MWSFLTKKTSHQVLEHKDIGINLDDVKHSQLINLEEKYVDNKEEKKGCLTRTKDMLYITASRLLFAQTALTTGICGFNAVTTIMAKMTNSVEHSEHEPSLSQNDQFILTLAIAIIGGSILSTLTYIGIQSASLKTEKLRLNALIRKAEETAKQSHDFVNLTIRKRTEVKKLLARAEERQVHIGKSFQPIESVQTIVMMPKKKKSEDFKWSCKSVGNIIFHSFAGTVTLTTHLLAIQTIINILQKYNNTDTKLSETNIWLVCGSLVLIFDGYGIFNIYKWINRNDELTQIFEEENDRFNDAETYFSETEIKFNTPFIDDKILSLTNQSGKLDILIREGKEIKSSFKSKREKCLKSSNCLSSSCCSKTTKGKEKARIKRVAIRLFQLLNALTAAGSVSSAQVGLYYFIKEHSSHFSEERWILGLGINGILAFFQAFYYGWHGIETGLYRFKLHKSPQQILENAITLIESETTRAAKKNGKMIQDLEKLKSILNDQSLALENDEHNLETLIKSYPCPSSTESVYSTPTEGEHEKKESPISHNTSTSYLGRLFSPSMHVDVVSTTLVADQKNPVPKESVPKIKSPESLNRLFTSPNKEKENFLITSPKKYVALPS